MDLWKNTKAKTKKAQMPKQKFEIKIGKAQKAKTEKPQKLFNIILRCISGACALWLKSWNQN